MMYHKTGYFIVRSSFVLKAHDKRIITQFTAQSEKFASGQYVVSSQEYLTWAVNKMPLKKSDLVLDVAAGTGLLSFAVSPFVGQVTAVDITPAMLDEGRKAASGKGILNVTFKQGNAYDLCEETGYDIAMSRLAFHHMSKPKDALNEMVKAVRPGGKVIVIDLVSPSDKKSADNYNYIETIRDDSHTRALTTEELLSMFKTAGLSDISVDERDVINDLEAWMTMTGTSSQNRGIINRAMQEDLNGGEKTGFSPFTDESGNIKFIHHWALVIGEKS